MSIGKVFLFLCGVTLAICVVLSVSALTVLRNAVSEAKKVSEDAASLLGTFETVLREESPAGSALSGEIPVMSESPTPEQGFTVRECNGKIGVFTLDGYFVRMLDVAPETLPECDRAALNEGITVSSWEELSALLCDLSG